MEVAAWLGIAVPPEMLCVTVPRLSEVSHSGVLSLLDRTGDDLVSGIRIVLTLTEGAKQQPAQSRIRALFKRNAVPRIVALQIRRENAGNKSVASIFHT